MSRFNIRARMLVPATAIVLLATCTPSDSTWDRSDDSFSGGQWAEGSHDSTVADESGGTSRVGTSRVASRVDESGGTSWFGASRVDESGGTSWFGTSRVDESGGTSWFSTPWFIPKGGSSAVTGPSLPVQAQRLVVVKEGGDLSLQAFSHAAALMKRAGEAPIRVIVGLRVDFRPEGGLSSKQAVEEQREAVAGARARLAKSLEGLDAAPVRELHPLPFVSMLVGREALDQLLLNPDVATIEEDGISRPLLNQSRPLIGASTAQASGADGSGVVLAILDSGVDLYHPYFTGRIVSQACYSTNDSYNNASSVCPGGASSSTAAGSGNACSSQVYGCDHGTQTAGIAAGKAPTYGGIAPEAGIIAIQVFTRFDDYYACGGYTPCVAGYDSDWLAGMNRVATLASSFSIAAVNLSLGSGSYSSACDSQMPSAKTAIDNLRSLGIATIAASGNDGYTNGIAAPACISTAISVGSTTKQDVVSSYSNSAAILDLLAPGEDIRAPTVGGGTVVSSGTSLSAPHVTGAWAALRGAVPAASVTEIFNALQSTGVSVADYRVSARVRPRIMVDDALDALGGVTTLVEPPSMQPPGGAFDGPAVVTLSSPTSGASIRYTTNGNDPTPTSGQTVSNNGSVTVGQSATLKAIAYVSSTESSVVAEADYRVRARLKVDIEPADAVAAGARFRQQNLSIEAFESGGFDRYDWNFTGHGSWVIATTDSPGVNFAHSPPLGHGQNASLHLDIESDGGDVVFIAAVSSEPNGDQLCFFVDGTQRGCWSGETDWQERSFPVSAGTRALRWTYSKDQSVSAGLDAAFLAVIALPGDQWRSPGETLRWLWTAPDQATTRITYESVPDWNKPSDLQVTLSPAQTTEIVGVYGGGTTVDRPVISPAGGTYFTSQQVSMTSATPGSTIHYTTNGAEPGLDSPLYVSPFVVPLETTLTVRARAFKVGSSPSPIAEETIRVTGTVADPVFSLAPGTYSSPQELGLSTATSQATIRYTLDGTEPNTGSPVFPSSMTLEQDTQTNIRARAYRQDWSPSAEIAGYFEIAGKVATPVLVPGGSLDVVNELEVRIETTTASAVLRYTVDGSTPTPSSQPYTAPIEILPGNAVHLCARGFRQDLQPSEIACAEYSVASRTQRPTFSPEPGSYDEPPTVTISTVESDATIHYTLDGSDPDQSSAQYAQPLEMPAFAATEVRAIAYREGFSDSEISVGRYEVHPTIRVLDENDRPLSSARLVRGQTLFFKIDGGTGDYSIEIVAPPNRTMGTIGDAAGGHVFVAPTEGAFAGPREIVVNDVNGATATVVVDVSLFILVEPKDLPAGSSEGVVVVLGGEPEALPVMEIVDLEGDLLTEAGRIIRQQPADDLPAEGNPAEAVLKIADDAEGLSFRVRASSEEAFGVSGVVTVTPVGTNGDGDGGCGCSSTGGGAGGGLPLFSLALFLLCCLRGRRAMGRQDPASAG